MIIVRLLHSLLREIQERIAAIWPNDQSAAGMQDRPHCWRFRAATGRSFKTMSLDMFIIKNDKITFSYHVENWIAGEDVASLPERHVIGRLYGHERQPARGRSRP
jgi:hypothetical protein